MNSNWPSLLTDAGKVDRLKRRQQSIARYEEESKQEAERQKSQKTQQKAAIATAQQTIDKNQREAVQQMVQQTKEAAEVRFDLSPSSSAIFELSSPPYCQQFDDSFSVSSRMIFVRGKSNLRARILIRRTKMRTRMTVKIKTRNLVNPILHLSVKSLLMKTFGKMNK